MTRLLKPREQYELAPEDAELIRQDNIMHVLIDRKRPRTAYELKAAAIGGYPEHNALLYTKIGIALDEILPLVASDATMLEERLENVRALTKVQQVIRTTAVRLSAGNTIRLPVRSTITPIKYAPVIGLTPTLITHPFGMVPLDDVSVVEFETMCFGNRVLMQYLTSESFASYLYENLLYSLGVNSVQELERDERWQAKLVRLLHHVQLCPVMARDVFYQDSIEYQGVVLDSSFVPKYDVRALVPQRPMRPTTWNRSAVKQWSKLDMKSIETVPTNMLDLFRIFPFKDGHLVLQKPPGKIIALIGNINHQSKSSSRLQLDAVLGCTPDVLNSELEKLALELPLADVLQWVSFQAKTLFEHAVGLLILRRMVGDFVDVPRYRVILPTQDAVMAWLPLFQERKCTTYEVLPPIDKNPSAAGQELITTVRNLIRDLASACGSVRGAVILSSRYTIPEYAVTAVLRSIDEEYGFRLQNPSSVCVRRVPSVTQPITTYTISGATLAQQHDRNLGDAERYILTTMILRDYDNPTIERMRSRLIKPAFGQTPVDTIDWSPYEHLRTRYRTVNFQSIASPHDRPDAIAMPSMISNEQQWGTDLCSPNSPSMQYRLRDDRLASLAREGSSAVPLISDEERTLAITLALEATDLAQAMGLGPIDKTEDTNGNETDIETDTGSDIEDDGFYF